MKDSTLYEVRCPNTVWKGNSSGQHCNALLGKVTGHSMGEFWCRKCKIVFKFVINDDGEVTYLDYEDETYTGRKITPEDRLLDLVNKKG